MTPSPGRGDAHGALLESIVTVARAIFGARAASIMLHDRAAGELVFRAVSGEGAGSLVGTRFPANRGIAGWVLSSGQPLVLEDVGADPRFARDVAERTGYTPRGLMAVPLFTQERTLGVLQVLDRPQRAQFSLREIELLGLFAEQGALALELTERAGREHTRLADATGAAGRLLAVLDDLGESARTRADALLDSLTAVLERDTR